MSVSSIDAWRRETVGSREAQLAERARPDEELSAPRRRATRACLRRRPRRRPRRSSRERRRRSRRWRRVSLVARRFARGHDAIVYHGRASAPHVSSAGERRHRPARRPAEPSTARAGRERERPDERRPDRRSAPRRGGHRRRARRCGPGWVCGIGAERRAVSTAGTRAGCSRRAEVRRPPRARRGRRRRGPTRRRHVTSALRLRRRPRRSGATAAAPPRRGAYQPRRLALDEEDALLLARRPPALDRDDVLAGIERDRLAVELAGLSVDRRPARRRASAPLASCARTTTLGMRSSTSASHRAQCDAHDRRARVARARDHRSRASSSMPLLAQRLARRSRRRCTRGRCRRRARGARVSESGDGAAEQRERDAGITCTRA